jgi:hypothetical protein
VSITTPTRAEAIFAPARSTYPTLPSRLAGPFLEATWSVSQSDGALHANPRTSGISLRRT